MNDATTLTCGRCGGRRYFKDTDDLLIPAYGVAIANEAAPLCSACRAALLKAIKRHCPRCGKRVRPCLETCRRLLEELGADQGGRALQLCRACRYAYRKEIGRPGRRAQPSAEALARRRRVIAAIDAGATLREVAAREGVSHQDVHQLYQAHAEPRRVSLYERWQARRKNRFSEDMLALLGTVEDKVLAARWGVSAPYVCTLRKRRGIPPLRRAGPRRDLSGQRIPGSRLTALRPERVNGRWRWVCRCSCGTETGPIEQGNLARTRSCGCLLREYRRDMRAYRGQGGVPV